MNSGMDAPSQTVTMHHGQRSACTIRCGVFSQIESIANDLKERRETINKMLCKYTGQSMKVMKKATAFDHWFDANEAKEFGLVDRIATDSDLFTMISGGK